MTVLGMRGDSSISFRCVDFRCAGASWPPSAPISPATAAAATSACPISRRASDGSSTRSSPTVPPSAISTYASPRIHALSVRRVPRICTSATTWLLQLRWLWNAAGIPPSGTTTSPGRLPTAIDHVNCIIS